MESKFNQMFKDLLTEAQYSEEEDFHYETDELRGKEFGHPDKFYHITLTGSYVMVDDSDYDRETGYGHQEMPEYRNTKDFTIEEIDPNGEVVRTQEQIEQEEPKLYNNLLSYAKEASMQQFQ